MNKSQITNSLLQNDDPQDLQEIDEQQLQQNFPEQSMLQFYKTEFLTDFLLIIDPEKPDSEIKLHKLVFSSRSKIFFNQFKFSTNSELKMPIAVESSLQKISSKDKDIILAVLQYFYSNLTAKDFQKILVKEGGLCPNNCLKYLSYFSALQFVKATMQLEAYIRKNHLTQGNCMVLLIDFIKMQNEFLVEECFKIIRNDFMNYLKKDKNKLIDLPLKCLISLLKSDELRVDKEDIVFSFVIDYIDKRYELPEKELPHFEVDKKNAPKLADVELPNFKEEIEGWDEKKKGCISCWEGISDIITYQYPNGLSNDPIKRQEQLVHIYTMETPVYHEVNQALRDDDKEQLHRFAGYINELRNVFETDHVNQIIDPFIGKSYRGITFPDLEDAKELYQKGRVFCWPAFTSTSTNKQVSVGFGNVLFEVSCFPSKKMLEDDDPEFVAAPINKWSQYKNEAEVLFSPNTKFKVTEVIENSEEYSGIIIKCETVAFDKKGVGQFSDFNQQNQGSPNIINKLLPTEAKKPSRQLYNDLDLNEHSEQLLAKYKLSTNEIEDLLKICRLSFVSHELIMSASQNYIFEEFKPTFIEAISAKLNQYEKLKGSEYHINCQPRKYYQGLIEENESKPQQMKQAQQTNKYQMNQQLQFYQNPQVIQQNQSKVLGKKNLAPQQQQFIQNQKILQQTPQLLPNQKPEDYQVFYLSTKKYLYFFNYHKLYQSQPQQQIDQNYQQQFQYSQQSMVYGKKPQLSQFPINFQYEYDFDENGVFHYLGTFGLTQNWKNPHNLVLYQYLKGLCQCFFSSLRAGQLGDLVGKEVINCGTLNELNSYMGVDLGEGRFLFPECYSIRNRNSSSHVLLNWDLEVSVDGQVWFVIDKRIHFSNDSKFNILMEKEREQLKLKGATSTWGIDLNLVSSVLINIKIQQQQNATMSNFQGFRYFRIVQQGKNSHGSDNLSLSGLELYGKAYGLWDFSNL